MIREKLRYAERHFHIRIVAFVSDSGGESKKARRLLALERPDLIILPCYAHQVCAYFCIIERTNSLLLGISYRRRLLQVQR